MKKIILASGSPRRKELLQKAGLTFSIVPSDYEEDMTLDLSPEQLAIFLSKGKAEFIQNSCPSDALIIAADTFIVYDDEIIGKPHTPERATETLKKLSGNQISVVTGITLIDNESEKIIHTSDETIAHVKNLTEGEIFDYVQTKEPLDCAGAFNISRRGRFIIERMDGSYTNTMGLPMKKLEEILQPYEITFIQDTELWLKKKLGY